MKNVKKNIICFDLDGTVCDILHREHLFDRNIRACEKLCFGDTPTKWSKHIIDLYSKFDYQFAFVSGRSYNTLYDTVEWIRTHLELKDDQYEIHLKKGSGSTSQHKIDSLIDISKRYNIKTFFEDHLSIYKKLQENKHLFGNPDIILVERNWNIEINNI